MPVVFNPPSRSDVRRPNAFEPAQLHKDSRIFDVLGILAAIAITLAAISTPLLVSRAAVEPSNASTKPHLTDH